MCDRRENYCGASHNQKKRIVESFNYPLGASPFDYYTLGKLPMPQQPIGAGFGTRTERDVMEWKNTMGSAPYPWGPNGNKFNYLQK